MEIAEQNVWVFGDLILDRYVTGKVKRISPEAPVPVLSSPGDFSLSLGGAGNAAANVASMGARAVLFAGCTKRQQRFFHQLCAHRRVSDAGIVPTSIEAPVKTRFMANSHHIMRWDTEIIMRADEAESEAYAQDIAKQMEIVAGSNAPTSVLLSDYDKGFLPPQLIRRVIFEMENEIPIIVDPKAKPLEIYSEATVLKMNQKEFGQYTGLSASCSDEEMLEAARRLLSANGIEAMVITLGSDGMKVAEANNEFLWHVPGKSVEVVDVTGAGDTVAAVLAVCLGMGITLQESARVANALAAKTVQQSGCGYTTLEDLETAIEYPDL